MKDKELIRFTDKDGIVLFTGDKEKVLNRAKEVKKNFDEEFEKAFKRVFKDGR